MDSCTADGLNVGPTVLEKIRAAVHVAAGKPLSPEKENALVLRALSEATARATPPAGQLTLDTFRGRPRAAPSVGHPGRGGVGHGRAVLRSNGQMSEAVPGTVMLQAVL